MPVIDKLTGATGLSGPHLLLGAVGVSIIIYIVGSAIYNVFFHPLASYPGPLIQRASYIPFGIRHTLGIQAFHTQTLHDKYGPVVRISPNHLSFTDHRAWKDVYGHIAGSRNGTEEMMKSLTFAHPVDEQAHHIISADRELHAKLRRGLANSFSDASMRGQGPLIGKYIDLLIHKLHEQGEEGRVPLNATNWYNCTTFDITGDLIFGMPFGALEGNGKHPWLEFILGSLKSVAPMGALSYIGLHWLVQVIWKMSGAEIFRKSMESVDLMLKERLKMDADRNDLFGGLIQRQEKLGLGFDELSANAWILVLAGSETTATTLSGVTYLLTQNPEVLKRVTQEVRTAFKSVDEIDINSVNKLTYMLAVLNETLRLYPPVTSNLPRVVPRGGAKVLGDLAYAEMRWILARILFEFDLRGSPTTANWIERQKSYGLWERIPLDVYFEPAREKR
ncbi:unnamed protein product [Sordaria macrospora k-hell]|uniref:WGS project CABT00000000 data, contig 2.4 n=1 Tax=Sordaria macrospora (strain ATCC MYA-333 / DSM 997 / K(L3346) / K-hell) TaxID=771870 RepID=F7VQQ2_SORMK|nr:uncharacterized protein SMAC_01399 [Sordaria macrospora k-hell]CCC07834.1 unnamed protein product [Sordaria macrospora k-hell]